MQQLCSLKEISPKGSGQKLGKILVEIEKDKLIISGNHNETIAFEKMVDFADSMSSDGSDSRFEALMFRIDLNNGNGARKLYFDYLSDNYKPEDDANELFAKFVDPLRKKFLKNIFGKNINELSDYNIRELYGSYRTSKDQRKMLYVFMCIAILIGWIFLSAFGWWSVPIVILLAITAWPISAITEISYEVSPQGFRKTNKFGSILIPWHQIKKLVRKEKRTGKGGNWVQWLYGIYYDHNGREKHYFINEQTLEASDFQALLTVLRYKLKNVPQLKSRGYNYWTGNVKEYVQWKLDQRT